MTQQRWWMPGIMIALLAGLLAGCPGRSPAGAARLDPVLADPKVGDLYAAELTHFSGADYSEAGEDSDEPAYGLLKVIEVTPRQVVAHSEMEAWDRPPGAVNDLRGDQSDIEWDSKEKIRIYRKDLPSLVAEKKIIEVRRPGAG